MGWSFFTSAGVRKLVNFNSGAATPTAVASNQAGIIIASFVSSIPNGWLECDGEAYPTEDYPNLFKAIDYTYGGSSGSFNVPDLTGAIPMGDTAGKGNGASGSGQITGTSIAAQTIGDIGGEEDVTLTSAESITRAHNHTTAEDEHSHDITDPGHVHRSLAYPRSIATTAGGTATSLLTSESAAGASLGERFTGTGGGLTSPSVDYIDEATMRSKFSVGTAAAEDAAASHTNMQPYIRVGYLIKI